MSSDSIAAFPLQWPVGWPRSIRRVNANGKFKHITMRRARASLIDELRRLKATNVTLSTNIRLRNDGEPISGLENAPDAGVVVYFTLRGKQLCMARDAYITVADNLRSLAIAIEHLRGMERHGGATMMDRAFSGFALLADPKARSCWDVLGLRKELIVGVGYDTDERRAVIVTAYRNLVKSAHPDMPGGSDEKLDELVKARDQAYHQALC